MIVENEKNYVFEELEWWEGKEVKEKELKCEDEFCWKHHRPCNGKVEECNY